MEILTPLKFNVLDVRVRLWPAEKGNGRRPSPEPICAVVAAVPVAEHAPTIPCVDEESVVKMFGPFFVLGRRQSKEGRWDVEIGVLRPHHLDMREGFSRCFNGRFHNPIDELLWGIVEFTRSECHVANG